MTEETPIVGGEEPRKPTHSLPRYSEPTPETHRKLSREEEAELALKHTVYTPGARWLLIALFLLTITSVPAIQFAVELRSPRPSGGLATFDIYRPYPAWARIRAARSVKDLWDLLPRAAELKAAEKSIESESVVSAWLLPRVQSVLTGKLRVGNEQVYLGRGAWLFYRPDVDYITGPPFLDPSQMRHRVHVDRVQPDPVKAIVDFRNQLAARGIDLIAVPVPMKPGIDGDKLSARVEEHAPLHNASFTEFKARLENAGVRIFDPGPSMIRRKNGAPLYLKSDTHWRPETMELIAEKLSFIIAPPGPLPRTPLEIRDKEISGLGDIARMLRLPPSQNLYRPEKVTIHEVLSGNAIWRPDKAAEILLLGDSFSNIFSLDALGWGESAGFAEHLSRALGGISLDCILRNSDAAFATREILSRELARGRDRLAGKKLVVWEFAARELAFGDWKMIEMKLGQPQSSRFFVPKTGKEVVVNGTVEAVSTVPRPGTVPYQDHILALHLTDLTVEGSPANEALESLVYLESMRDNILTAAARLRPGDRVKLRLHAWTDVSDRYEKINRSEIDDPSIQLEEPCWGEIVK
ncbi:MAG: alginate O-acetyltransferase complex protein AlgJ [Verrucomicrobiota bacterium]